MKHFYFTMRGLALAVFSLTALSLHAQLELPRGSQKASVTQRVGISDVTIDYSRPRVNDREIWGALVPYGMNNLGFGTAKESPWRAGADENTTITLTHNAQVEGMDLAAGTYGLHMIIEPDNRATIIFSKKNTAWGSFFYDPSQDALRVDVQMKESPHTEWLEYSFTDLSVNSTTARLRWEEKEIPFTIAFNTPAIVLAKIRQDLENEEGFSRQSWEQAANYALNNGGDLDEALGWINAAIADQFFSQKNFNNLVVKAQILRAQNKTDAAEAIIDEALPLGTVFEVHTYGRQLIAAGAPQEALKVFQKNAKLHKNTWPVDLGLARGYSAIGDYEKALKHLKIAQERAPDELNQNAIAANIAKIEAGEDIN
ncbi:DUF2911 domain-containing protein [Robiginitalea sp. SC105]|uniref:DUF2911 domain-containing protein n=1 Tax=Robiginitalea sp. SC105 TaxID=2762332 RepID=UPI001639DB15|nr:DUF2911 domain-containing protein [Robiginitalea sp. SC105]MBC2840466.1 DUF2911 domain-containing protein [Robiginitalea sp. SC105]